ncbi:hypothetical protein ACE38W_17360 [Chitinophaga sp. Hz27]|uniref:hypothetical protein n=1 Tax=Chitinophaga sp. Hz27 TaxID=3347169 RepID=UPI0035D944B1
MKSVYKYLIILFAFSSCYKLKGDLSGQSYIRGRLFLTDTITRHAIDSSLGKKTVIISYNNNDTLNYLLSTVTDNDGYFLFQNLQAGQTYRVYYEETVNGLTYTAQRIITAPQDTLILSASPALKKQTGLRVTITDGNGGYIAKVPICIFSSPVGGFNNNSCDGSSYSMTTNASGTDAIFSIPAHKYYILAKVNLGDMTLNLTTTADVKDSVVSITMTATRPTVSNGFEFTITDSTGAILPTADICLFTSPVLYKLGSCDGSNYHISGNLKGKGSIYNIAAADYYILATKIVGTDTFITRPSAAISADNTIKQVPLTLYHK